MNKKEQMKKLTKKFFIEQKVKEIIIVQNKIDLVTQEQALKNYKQIKVFVKGTIAENSPIIPISAQQGVNIDKVKDLLLSIPIPTRDLDSPPEFLIARSFDINKPGTKIKNLKGGVLGGILRQGTSKKGDEIEIKPGLTTKKHNEQIYETLTTKILSLYKGTESVDEIKPGTSISIETELDPLLTKTDSLTGNVISTKGNLPEITHDLKIKTQLFKEVLGKKDEDKEEKKDEETPRVEGEDVKKGQEKQTDQPSPETHSEKQTKKSTST